MRSRCRRSGASPGHECWKRFSHLATRRRQGPENPFLAARHAEAISIHLGQHPTISCISREWPPPLGARSWGRGRRRSSRRRATVAVKRQIQEALRDEPRCDRQRLRQWSEHQQRRRPHRRTGICSRAISSPRRSITVRASLSMLRSFPRRGGGSASLPGGGSPDARLWTNGRAPRPNRSDTQTRTSHSDGRCRLRHLAILRRT